MSVKVDQWETKLQSILNTHDELQTWRGHLNIRMDELRTIVSLQALRKHFDESLVELGCGNGFASAYMSPFFKKIYATDLDYEDHSKHSVGLSRARQLFELLEINNVELHGGSGEEIRLPDESVGVVFSMFVLEHIENRQKCLQESMRVLKPGGHIVMAVPCFGSTFFYPFSFYSEFLQRVMKRLMPIQGKRTSQVVDRNDLFKQPLSEPVVKDMASFRKAYPHFPFPEPHGEYSSYLDELFQQRATAWIELLESAEFREVEATPLSILPRGLFSAILGNSGVSLYQRFKWLDDSLRKRQSLNSVAQYVCLTGRKP